MVGGYRCRHSPRILWHWSDHFGLYGPHQSRNTSRKQKVLYPMNTTQKKVTFSGKIVSIQPRSNVWRYRLDNRTHTLTGYNVFLKKDACSFTIAISEKQYQKHGFRIGDVIEGTGWTKLYPKLEYADYYRCGALAILDRGDEKTTSASPYQGELPDLATYSWRGCRMLDSRRWKGKCFTCKWAAMANVTIEYNWGVSQKHRFETFCYGPKSCKLYTMGKERAVPDKHCGTCYDVGWMDDLCTENRGYDE